MNASAIKILPFLYVKSKQNVAKAPMSKMVTLLHMFTYNLETVLSGRNDNCAYCQKRKMIMNS